jgi:hypothetical protein
MEEQFWWALAGWLVDILVVENHKHKIFSLVSVAGLI